MMAAYTKEAKLSFRDRYTYEKRLSESDRIISQYPDRTPVIIEVNPRHKSKIELSRDKYLVPKDFTVGALLSVIYKRNNMRPETALFLFTTQNQLIPTDLLVIHLPKEKDGFRYIIICVEDTFGSF
jgi:hypothetical protein